MKRLALALATTLATSGCFVANDCNSRNVSVTWSGFDGPGAALNQSCAAAGVPYVDLWLDGQQVLGPVAGHFNCGDYGEVVGAIPNGNHLMTVEGLAGDGTTINFRDEISFGASGCNDLALPTATPGAGTADLVYAFQSGTSCASASSYMWFTIFDVIANQTDPASVGATRTPRAFPCGPTDPVVTLPNGTYQLTSMNEMVENPPGTFTSAAYLCKAPVSFDVFSRTQTNVAPSLADQGVACLP